MNAPQKISAETGSASLPASLPYVLRDDRDGIATLTLNRGERFNPLSRPMIEALAALFDAIAQDVSVRVVVIAAKGRGFCAGHDLKELRGKNDPAWHQGMFDACAAMMMRMTRLPQPVIARVHGIATAAGAQLVSMCDLAVASRDATFALPGVSIGLYCSTPAVGVARNINRKRAMEMLLTGDMIDAATALQWGLINHVVEPQQLDAEIDRLAHAIKARSATVIALGKEVFYKQVELDMAAAYELTGRTMTSNLALEDAAEGLDAFIGKRQPVWKDK